MFRQLTLVFLLSLVAVNLLGQELDLATFNSMRLEKQGVSMMVLGGWAVANIATGAALYGSASGEDRYFHLMNVGWNVINLGLATFGYLGAVKSDPAAFDLLQSLQAQNRMEKILLFNAGLDVGYILGGVYLRERAKRDTKNPERLAGFGKSIILQGAFLFAFDLTAFYLLNKHGQQLHPLLSNLYFDGQQIGLALTF